MSDDSAGASPGDPIGRFHALLERARSTEIDATAMVLATATPDGRPSSRVVLLKGVDESGFAFFTNYTSRKARELLANPHASLCVHYATITEQVRIEGAVEQVGAEESDAYFATRPRGSQIGAWASEQSAPLATRALLEARVREVEERFSGRDVERPSYWGGFRVVPSSIEFWSGRPSRLHERDLYVRGETGRGQATWRLVHLYP